MWFLLLSLIALAIGPGLYRLARARDWAMILLDNFIFVTIGGLVMLHSLPHSFEQIGPWALLMIAMGLFAPTAAEKMLTRAAREVHLLTMFLAIGGFCFHALIDGLALASGDLHLALAILLHRIPDGLIIWWLVYQPYGIRSSIVSLILIGLATIGGFFLNAPLTRMMGPYLVGFVQALVGGMLLHVAIHRPHVGHKHVSPMPKTKRWLIEIFGLLAGIALLVVLNPLHHENHSDEGATWLTLLGLAIFVVFVARRYLRQSHKHDHHHHHVHN